MLDNFDVKKVYEDRMHEQERFTFTLYGKEYKGNFHNNSIRWLHPHPKQDVNPSKLAWVEREIHRLLGDTEDIDDGALEDVCDIEVDTFLKGKTQEAHQFKVKIEDEEFKGLVRDGKLAWFHPKPRRKVAEKVVKNVEKKLHEKVEEQKEEDR